MTLREAILQQFVFCKEIAEDIKKNHASEAILRYAKKWAEIESPMSGETEAPWIRICYGDIYIFIHLTENSLINNVAPVFTGEMWYQLDGRGGYGGEEIDVKTESEFMGRFNSLTDEELLRQHYAELDDYSEDAPEPYVPFECLEQETA